MKRITKLFSLIAILLMIVTLTGCKVTKDYADREITLKSEILEIKDATVGSLILLQASEEEIVGFIYFDEKNPSETTLYVNLDCKIKAEHLNENLKGLKAGSEEGLLPKMPSGLSIGSNFAGWFVDGQRVTTFSQVQATSQGYVTAKYVSYGEAGILALVCIGIVFLMLALLWGVTALFRFIAPKQKAKEETKAVSMPEPKKQFTMADITDEDMMVAALVATIDYRNENKEDVRVVSIKEIR